MTTPIVTEIVRQLEPVTRDRFIHEPADEGRSSVVYPAAGPHALSRSEASTSPDLRSA